MPTKIVWNDQGGSAKSPNGAYEARFVNANEFRTDTFCWDVELDDLFLGERFADKCLWSADSRFFAVCQYLKNTNALITQTQVVVVDMVREMRCALRAGDTNGLAIPTRFDQHRIICEQTNYGQTGTVSYLFGIDLTQADLWEAI